MSQVSQKFPLRSISLGF